MTTAPFNKHGGLTLVPMTGFEGVAKQLRAFIETKSSGVGLEYTPVDIATPYFNLRPSGEPFVRLGKDHIGGHDCYILTSGPGTHKMLTELMLLIGYVAARKASRITVITGYLPLSRSDKDEGELELALPPFIMRSMFSNAQGLLKRVVCVDPHADQLVMAAEPGVITPVYLTLRLLRAVVEDALKQTDRVCIAFPDDTAAKRFEPAMEILKHEHGGRIFPVVATAARRSSGLKKEIKHLVGDLHELPGSHVLTFDDETATGGSQIKAAEQFKSAHGAAAVWAAVSHGVLCGNAVEQFSDPDSPVDRLYITDTIPLHTHMDRGRLAALEASQRLRVLSWNKDCAEIIFHLHWDRSIRGIRGAKPDS